MASSKLPTTIKAVHQLDPQSPALAVVETPLPKPSDPEDHLIKVKATAPCLNELTWEVSFPGLLPPDRERVPCTECAGVVVSGPDASAFRPGDEVYFRLDAKRPGCLREYTLGRTPELARRPRTLGWVEAAATPLSSLTAWQGLFEHGLLDKRALNGDSGARARNGRRRVLITAAGGSVGSWAVQFAAAAGAGAIVAVCGPSKAEHVRREGATDIVDYTKQSVAEWAGQDESRQCDMVLDCIGGQMLTGCWSAVKEGGVLLSVADEPDSLKPESVDKKLAKSAWFLMKCKGEDLAEIAAIIDAGKAKPWIDSVVEFDDFQLAFDKVEGKRTKGKVVIKVDV